MSMQSFPVLMNQGLDLVTPPLLAEPGALIDCLNYEMTAHVGYRRIDGYERYDGWVDGGVASFFSTTLVADVPADQSKVEPGALLGSLDNAGGSPIYYGVVVDVVGTTIRYVPFRRNDVINVNQRVYLLTGGITYFFTATTGSVNGKAIATDMAQYTQDLRNYSALLRNLVQADPSAIAGITWSRDRLYKVLNMTFATWLNASANALPAGQRFSYAGKVWVASHKAEATPTTQVVWFFPTGENSANDPTKYITLLPNGSNSAEVAAPSIPASSTGSEYGYLVYANNPTISMVRGNTTVMPAITISMENGKWADNTGPISGVDYLWLTNGSTTFKMLIANWVATDLDGSWTAGTKKVRMQLVMDSRVAGVAWLPAATWSVHSAWTGTPENKVGDVVGTVSYGKLAGTGALRRRGTRYQWGTYNFYAREDMYELYGSNGVMRGFWAKPGSWGNIYTQDDEALDDPKYITMHARNNLVLGFADGSIMVSVGGEPYNYDGTLGAVEMATGDRITGLLEATGDSTLIFGKRSIGRLTGTDDSTFALKTVVPNAGAYDYTAVNVGGVPVFTDPAGISTLEQSSAYGDFVGERSTFKISTWLAPKLVPTPDSIELGGVACAFPVREKMQYRLFLNSGEVVSLCLSSEGPKPMFSNYAIQDVPEASSIRVPFAWTSEVSDSGKEMLHVVWDRELSQQGYDGTVGSLPMDNRTYRLDYGWGYDGRMMCHYFVLAHTFMSNGSINGQVTGLRLYGQGYGVQTLDIKSSSIETDFDMDFNETPQDISLPPVQKHFYDRMKDVTSIVDHANWGIGTKFKIGGTIVEGSPITEPAYTAQIVVMTLDTIGAPDG